MSKASSRHATLLEARREQPDLVVRFMLASEPGQVYEGTIERAALATTAPPGESPALTMIVRFDREQAQELHAGATVSARIQCGRRSLGYVWLHGVYERLRLQFFF